MPDPTGYISIPTELIRGLDWKRACRCASTADVDLAADVAAGDTLDGVTLVTGDRILLKDQTDATENGIYKVAATGAPLRAHDMDQDLTFPVPADEFSGAFTYVRDGTTHAGQLWHLTNPDPPLIGTDDLLFEEFSGGSSTPAGHYETLMAAGSSPLSPIETGDGLDWLYVFVPD